MSQTEIRPAWLLLVHQLPPRPSHVRVKTWRRLQELGAIALKNSVYVLPNSDPAPPKGDRLDTARFQKRVWVTRPRPGIDRMSSAWLIRRFIDPKARFAFAETPPASGAAIPFDMYGVEFSHSDHGCTFETLAA